MGFAAWQGASVARKAQPSSMMASCPGRGAASAVILKVVARGPEPRRAALAPQDGVLLSCALRQVSC
jgi:hypothetical protein